MATPLVAGCAAVLHEALTSRYQGISPSAALIKALLINGADILNYTPSNFVPSYNSGFGRVNMANAIAVVCKGPGIGFFVDDVSDSKRKWEKGMKVEHQNTTLKATLVWSDPPGENIMNKLRLGVARNASMPKYAIGTNNVQQVVWKDISSGDVMLNVDIIGKLDKSPQPFAVSWRLY